MKLPRYNNNNNDDAKECQYGWQETELADNIALLPAIYHAP